MPTPPSTTQVVKTTAQFQAALANPAVKSITLDASVGSVGDEFVANHLVNIDLKNRNLTGNLTINTQESGTLDIKTAGGTIQGNLTVDAANATINNYATASGDIYINNVKENTWNENANGNRLTVKDPDGITLNVGSGNKVASINVAATASSTSGAVVVITNNGTIQNVEANATTSLVNNGTIATVDAQAPVDLVNNKGAIVTTVAGTKEVTIAGEGTVENIKNPATEASEANKAVAQAKQAVEEATFSKLDLEGGKKTKDQALEAAVKSLVGEDITVSISGSNVTLSKEKAENKNVAVSDLTYDTDIHVTQATFKDYESGQGKTIVLGIDKNRSIKTLPVGTKVSVFAAKGKNLGAGLGINTLLLATDITREDSSKAWGLSTTLLYNKGVQGKYAWDSKVLSAFDSEAVPGFVKIEYVKDGITFSKIVALSEQQ